MNVLVIGSGASAHAMVWKLKESEKDLSVICSPGNGGITEVVECLDIEETNIDRLLELAIVRNIDLTIVASEKALAFGIVDRFREANKLIFGATKAAAEISWSKSFAKEFMLKHELPAPLFAAFDVMGHALAYASVQKTPYLIRPDGIPKSQDLPEYFLIEDSSQAETAIRACFDGHYIGSKKVVIEEIISGQEISIYAICDGDIALTMLPTQSYKNLEDGDEGPLTDGMGAYAPSPNMTPELLQRVRHEILNPFIEAMRSDNRPYSGGLEISLLLDQEGKFYIRDFHSVIGDLSSQVVLPLLDEDLYDICRASARENLTVFEKGLHKLMGAALSVSLVHNNGSDNHNGHIIDFSKLNEVDTSISGSPGELEQILKAKSLIFHQGTEKLGNAFITNRKNVIGATAVADSLVDAQMLAYKLVDKIDFPGKYYRKDIGDSGMID